MIMQPKMLQALVGAKTPKECMIIMAACMVMYGYMFYVRKRCMMIVGSRLLPIEVGCAKLGRKMNLSKKTKSASFRVKLSSFLETEF